MRNIISTAWHKLSKPLTGPLGNQDGSVILIALMLLLVMTIIGLSASETSVTESYILRNTAIYNQNVDLLQSAAEEIAQEVLIDIPDPAAPYLSSKSPVKEPYIISLADWKNASLNGGVSLKDDWFTADNTDRVLSGSSTPVTDSYDPGLQWTGHTTFPEWVEPQCAGTLPLINNVRGKSGVPLRVCLVGWEPAPHASMKVTKPTRKSGYIMAEYVSPKYGMMRLEIGVERKF